MFIHLGEDIIIRTEEVIAILAYDLFQKDKGNKLFIDQVIKDKKFLDLGHHLTKSVVVTDHCTYYSPFSPSTLKRRSQQSFHTI
ncbi:extracellular matrix regulator RemB [Camelliibacillus cellulosilyticus]|uniref:Extracellular matrix regulator RemB n=1 Tax=Camelliibacillus cellulosilyticus TaxID=2174486 RepID=A0ABV9GQY5_9BACL